MHGKYEISIKITMVLKPRFMLQKGGKGREGFAADKLVMEVAVAMVHNNCHSCATHDPYNWPCI